MAASITETKLVRTDTATAVPMRRREMRRQEREASILEAAKSLMATVGYEAMTMDELAAKAGISKPTLYQHFPSKEAIAIQAIVDLMRSGREYIVDLDDALTPVQRLEMVFQHLIRTKLEHGHLSFGPAARAALVPVIRANPDYQREFGGMIAAICGIIEEAKADGSVRQDLPTRPAAQMIFSIMRDSEYEELITRGECTLDAVTNSIKAVLLDGMRTRQG